MLRTYQYRLYPTDEQQSTLDDILYVARWLYNHALAYRRKRWYESRKPVTYNEQAAMWRDWRNEQPEDNPLRLLNMSAGQQVLRRLDQVYREFLKGARGKPRFKGRRFFKSVNYKPGDQGRAALHSECWPDGRQVASRSPGRKAQEHHHCSQGVRLVCMLSDRTRDRSAAAVW